MLENLHLRTIDFRLSPGRTRTRSTTCRKSTFVYFCIFLYIFEPLAKSRLGLGLLIEPGTNITIVVGERHLCPSSECELFDFCKSLSYILLALYSIFRYPFSLARSTWPVTKAPNRANRVL